MTMFDNKNKIIEIYGDEEYKGFDLKFRLKPAACV